jgi:hypothetical protein
MKKILTIYGSGLVALCILCILAIQLSQGTGISGALGKLGRGEKEFQETRNFVLMCASDPAPSLIAFTLNSKKPARARVQALAILEELTAHQDLDSLSYRIIPLVRAQQPEVRLSALKTLARMGIAKNDPAITRIIATETDTEVVNWCLRALLQGGNILDQRVTKAAGLQNQAQVDSLCAILDSFPATYGATMKRIAMYYKDRGEDKKAALYYGRMGPIRKWWVLAPFANTGMTAYYQALEPETAAFDTNRTYESGDAKVGKLQWKTEFRVGEMGFLNLYELIQKNFNVVGYLMIYVIVPTERYALLHTGSDDGFKLWVNGEYIFTSELYHADHHEMDLNRIRLHAGTNTLLVKVGQEFGDWGFTGRLTGLDGNAMADAVVSLGPQVQANPEAQLVDKCTGRMDSCAGAIMPLGGADDEAIAGCLRVFGDEAAPLNRRMAALKVIMFTNYARPLNIGPDLAAAAKKAYLAGLRGLALDTMAGIFSQMAPAYTLDLGTMIRADKSPRTALSAGVLILAYSRNRLVPYKDTIRTDKNALSRTLGEIDMLDPADAGFSLFMAKQYVRVSDPAKAAAIKAKFAMASKWLLHTGISPEKNTQGKEEFSFADSFAAAGRNGSSWIPCSTAASTETCPVALDLTNRFPAASDKKPAILVSEITCGKEDSLLLDIWLPVPFKELRVNGKEVPQSSILGEPVREGSRYTPMSMDQMQNFYAPVRLKKGANRISITFIDAWPSPKSPRFFRCGVTQLNGSPIACDGLVLRQEQK